MSTPRQLAYNVDVDCDSSVAHAATKLRLHTACSGERAVLRVTLVFAGALQKRPRPLVAPLSVRAVSRFGASPWGLLRRE